jgi:hypothetical protein
MYSNELDQNKRYTKLVLFVTIDGNELLRFQNSYKLIGIAVHSYGNIDVEDVSNLQKSSSYYIKPELQTLLITTDQQFLGELNKGDHLTIYFLVLIPESISSFTFTTLHQARSGGAKILPIGIGPP